MRIAGIQDSLRDSDGTAIVVYTQGCSIEPKCSSCFNPELWDKAGGMEVTVEELKGIIKEYILWEDCLVWQGGEPTDQLDEVIEVSKWAKGQGVKVWLYTGRLFEHLPEGIKEHTDVIIDGRFIKEQSPTDKRFRGSDNQKMYRKIDGAWILID